jgi:hypothetical protein
MKRRLTYALAGLALLLSVAAGALAAEVDGAAGLADLTNGTINVDSGGEHRLASQVGDPNPEDPVPTGIIAPLAPPPAVAVTYDLENILVSSY